VCPHARPSDPQRATATVDAAGDLVTPAVVQPDIHLDAVLTVGQPRYKQSGSLFEVIAIWGERVRDPELVALRACRSTVSRQVAAPTR
jgi:cytosine deaminase